MGSKTYIPFGFTFLKNGSEWKVRPTNEKKKKLSEYLKRGKAVARPLAVTIKRVSKIVMKQWKRPKTIYRNLSYLNWKIRLDVLRKKFLKLRTQDLDGTEDVE